MKSGGKEQVGTSRNGSSPRNNEDAKIMMGIPELMDRRVSIQSFILEMAFKALTFLLLHFFSDSSILGCTQRYGTLSRK